MKIWESCIRRLRDIRKRNDQDTYENCPDHIKSYVSDDIGHDTNVLFLLFSVMALCDHPELKKSLTPPLIIHTAATPMSMPKSAIYGEVAQDYGSRRASGISMDPNTFDLKSPVCGSPSPLYPLLLAFAPRLLAYFKINLFHRLDVFWHC